MKAKKKLDDNLAIRLTRKAGVTQEVLDWLNSRDKVAQEMIKAIKLTIRIESTEAKSLDTIRAELDLETKYLAKQGNYGHNRGSYKQKDNIAEVVQDEFNTRREVAVSSNIKNKVQAADDEIFSDTEPISNKKQKNKGKQSSPLLRAVNSLER